MAYNPTKYREQLTTASRVFLTEARDGYRNTAENLQQRLTETHDKLRAVEAELASRTRRPKEAYRRLPLGTVVQFRRNLLGAPSSSSVMVVALKLEDNNWTAYMDGVPPLRKMSDEAIADYAGDNPVSYSQPQWWHPLLNTDTSEEEPT